MRAYLPRMTPQVLTACLVLALAPASLCQKADNVPAADQALQTGVDALQHDDGPGAVQAFTTVTQLRPRFAEGFLDLGLAYEHTGDYAQASTALERALTLKPAIRGGSLFLGIADYQLGMYPKAEQALLKATHTPLKDATAFMWFGITQLALGHNEAAVVSLDEAYTLSPKDPDILYHRGRAHMLISKDSYAQMFALDSDSYRVHEVLGQADAEADRTPDAIGEYKLAIERAPTKTGLHEELGDLYWVNGQMSLADAAYVQEIAIDPRSLTSLYKLGSLRVIVGRPAEALQPLQQSVALDEHFENAFYYLGRAQVELGQEESGIANLRRASVANGDEDLNTLAYYQLARAYRRLHRTTEAAAALAEFRRLRDGLDARQKARRADNMQRHRSLPIPEAIPAGPDATGPA